MVSRRRFLRETVMKILFQFDFRPEDFEQIVEEEIRILRDPALQKDVERYASGIYKNLSMIDGIISKYLINWDFDRVSHLERSVLRLATYELLFEPNVPIEVTLDEAIEIAKKYGTDESGKFVNGVLDKVAKHEAPREKFQL